MARQLRRATLLAPFILLAGFLALSCFDNSTGPRVFPGRFSIVPQFASSAAEIVTLDRFRVLLRRTSDSSVALDTTIAITPGTDSVDLSLAVPMFSSSETFLLTLSLITPAGDTAFQAGPTTVTPSSTGGEPPAIPLTVVYTGVGSHARAVQITTLNPDVFFGDTVTLAAEALDSNGAVIPGTPIAWGSLDTLRARVPNAGQGKVVGVSQRGVARVTATLLNGPADTVGVLVQPTPARMAVETGNNQLAQVTTALAQPVRFRVKAADSLGVKDVVVKFSVAAGGGTLSLDSAVTNDSGRVEVQWTLGPTAGSQTIRARIKAAIPDSVVTALAKALAGPPDSFAIVAGDSQSAVAGTVLPTAPGVVVRDSLNNLVPGATVTFQVTAGGGSITGASPKTDSAGVARVGSWTLGTAAGGNALRAWVLRGPGDTLSVNFSAIGIAGPISAATSTVSVTTSVITSGSTATLTLRARDGSGNTVTTGGATVVFTASGGSGVSTGMIGATADSGNGVYTATFTGVLAGTATTIGATINGGAVTSTLPAVTVTPGTASQLAFTAQPGNATAGAAITPAVQVTARDAAGNTATGFNGSVAVAIGTNPAGGTLSGTSPVGAVNGVATFSDLTIDNIGTGYTLVASATGLSSATSSAFDIVAPTAGIYWTNASGGNWSNPANWNPARLPISTDTVYIQQSGTYTVTLDTSATVLVLHLGGSSGTQTLAGSTRTLTLNGTSTVSPNGVLSLTNSTVGGTGALVNQGSDTLRATTISIPLTNQGTLVASGASALNGALTTAGGSTLRVGQVDGSTSLASLTVASGFTNNGAIELTTRFNAAYSATLTVTSGALTNASGGTISALAGTQGGGARTLAVQLINQGTVTVSVPLALTGTAVADTNSGTINISSGDLILTQGSGSFTNTGTGTITVGAGHTLSVNGGTFTYRTRGALNGGGILTLTSVTAAFDTTFVLSTVNATNSTLGFGKDQSTATTAFFFSNSTINGPGIFTNATGQTLTLVASTMNAALVNQGTLLASGTSALNGTLTTAGGSSLQVGQLDGSTSLANLTVASGFTNNGAIELTTIFNAAYSASLTVTGGTLTNASGGTISALAGTVAGGSRTLAAQLINQGTVTVSVPLALTRASVADSNSGTISVSGGDLTLTQTGGSFTNTGTGTITVGAGRTWSITGGIFTHQTLALLNGGGILSLTSVTAAFDTTFALDTLKAANSTLGFARDQSTASTAFRFSNSTINGPGIFTNATGQTLTLVASTMNAALVNQGTLVASGTSALNGAFTTAGGSILQVGQVDGSTSLASLTVASGFVNNGAIELTTLFNAAYSATLTVTSGALNNANSGTISALAGTQGGGSRTLAAQLINQGTVTVSVPLALTRASVADTNSGTIAVSGGDLILTQTGGSYTNTGTGTVTVGTGRTWSITGGSLAHQTPALLNGGGVLSLTSVTASFDTSFALDTLKAANSTLGFARDQSTATTAFAFSNSTINGPGVFTNASGQTLTLVASTMNAALINQGILVTSGASALNGTLTTATGSTLRVGQLDGSTSLANLTVANGFTNNGAIELTTAFAAAYSAALTVTSGTLTNATGGTIDALPGTVAGGSRTLAAQLDNQAGATVTVSVPLTINQASAIHTNSGTVNVSGGDLTVTQTGVGPSFTNTGLVDIAAGRTFLVSGGAFTNASTPTTGTIRGSGTLDVSTVSAPVFAGVISPGTSPGLLSVTGNLPQQTTAITNIELSGTTVGTQYDRLTVSGAATLDGELNVTTPSFTPLPNDNFQVLTFASRGGQFANLTGLDLYPAAGTGTALDTVWSATALNLRTQGQIVFSADTAGGGPGSGLRRTNASNTFAVNVSTDGSYDGYPRWSPDRRRLTYTPGGALQIVDADGSSTPIVLVTDMLAQRARYSPDGIHLAFECGTAAAGITDVCTIADVTAPSAGMGNGAGKVMVTDSVASQLGGPSSFAWNPANSNQLAVVRDTAYSGGVTSRIYLVNVDGTGVTLVRELPVARHVMTTTYQVATMDWSPDGSRLAFAVVDDSAAGEQRIWTLTIAGAVLDTVSAPATGERDLQPVFSPDGAEILFQRDLTQCGPGVHYVITSASTGTERVEIPTTVYCEGSTDAGADWSPDGSQIVLVDGGYLIGPNLPYVVPSSVTAANYLSVRALVGWLGDTSNASGRNPSWRP